MDAGPLPSSTYGAGPRLVAVHGFTQDRRCWGRAAGDLSRDHEVVALDCPGHGEAAEVRQGLWPGAAAIGEAGGSACYLGYSMGARLCLHLALSRPGIVTSLVLVSGTAGIPSADDRSNRRARDDALASRIERIGTPRFVEEWLAGPMFADLPEEARFTEERSDASGEGLAWSLRMMGTGVQAPLWRRLGELRMPVLLVAGSRDRAYAATAHEMSEAWGGHATVRILAGAGHAAHLEQPEAFCEAVRSWERTVGQAENHIPAAKRAP